MGYCKIYTSYEDGEISESKVIRLEDGELLIRQLNKKLNTISDVKGYSIKHIKYPTDNDLDDAYNYLIEQGDASVIIADTLKLGNSQLMREAEKTNIIESVSPIYWEKKAEYYYTSAKSEWLKKSLAKM